VDHPAKLRFWPCCRFGFQILKFGIQMLILSIQSAWFDQAEDIQLDTQKKTIDPFKK
jgi:hypothetical protein